MSNVQAPRAGAAGPTLEVTLGLGGMTRASCANRIERAPEKVEGVAAAGEDLYG